MAQCVWIYEVDSKRILKKTKFYKTDYLGSLQKIWTGLDKEQYGQTPEGLIEKEDM